MANATIKGINDRYAAIIGCGAAFTLAAVVTLGMRVMSKLLTRAPFAWEDYTVFFATALYIVTESLMFRAVTVGRYSKVVNDQEDQTLTKYMYIWSIFYFAIVGLSIASILLLYRRVFIKPFINIGTTVLLVVTVCWWIPCTIIETGYFSTPPERWAGEPANANPFGITYLTWWFAVGLIEQVIIVVAIFLPVREIYLLHLSLQKKISIMLIFAISYICVGTGIARLATIYHPTKQDFDISLGDIWISAHLGTAIMSANLPVCWPIVLRAKHALGMSNHSEERLDNKALGMEEARGRKPRPSPRGERIDSGVGTVLEAATLGAVTKDGDVRHGSMAHDMGSDAGLDAGSYFPASSDTAIAKEGRTIQDQDRSRKPSRRWLELRPVNWQISFRGSMFGSQPSQLG